MSPPQQHVRQTTTSTTRRVLPTRPLRPPPLGSRKNSHCGPSKKSPVGSKPSNAFGRNPQKKESALQLDTEEEDMAGLPQFCATCEKQILTPAGISILYCSESCRRKDTNKPLSHSILPSEPSPQPTTPRTSYFGDDTRHDILPMRSPTVVRPPSLAFSDSSDSSSINETRPSYRYSESDASGHNHHHPQVSRRSSYEPFSTPSLSHTPASYISTAGSYLSSRPLQRRSNPYSASFSSLSVDLVTPVVNAEPLTGPSSLHQNASLRSCASTSTAFRVAEGEMSYEKNSYMPNTSPSAGSLKQLFSHEAMQASPRASHHFPASRDWQENREHRETPIF